MDLSTKSTTTILLLIFTLTLSSLLSISISQDIAPSPSSSSTDDSSASPSLSSSSSANGSPAMSPSDALMQDKEPADISAPSGSVSSDLTTTSSSSPTSSEVTTADPSISIDDASSSSTTAPSPSPDASFPSFPTMFSTKFERKMQENSITKATDMVKELCSGTENPAKCMEFFRDSRSDDPAEIIHTEIGTLKTLVQEGISAATKVRRQDNAASGVLDVCLENYDKAIGNLDKASATCEKCIRSTPKCSPKNTSEVKTMLSAVISNVGYCDEAFNAQGLAPPMKATNEAVIELTDWLLEFCKKLGHKY
ncbi:unnamed protein product [Linum trigynum]|uniref:Pectinesterase inhibitor domain-containing protein n=1 Tax=Linum trigynum TaxID=586398 RepID=A0AAV2FRM4_9ROSI